MTRDTTTAARLSIATINPFLSVARQYTDEELCRLMQTCALELKERFQRKQRDEVRPTVARVTESRRALNAPDDREGPRLRLVK